MEANEQEQITHFDGVKTVIGDHLRFKRKLAIGEDAYASLRVAKTVQQLWDIGGVAGPTDTVAASPVIAGTFFASGGFLSAIGLGAAAVTPVGWVIGASVASAGAYYGVTRLFRSYAGSRVDTIPKFINTPIDVLGASIFDMLGSLGVKVAGLDGKVTVPEREALLEYFVEEWGFDQNYASSALLVLEVNCNQQRLAEMVAVFTAFARLNPDCNFEAMSKELVGLLREVAAADGKVDEVEELAIEKVERLLRETGSVASRVASVQKNVAGWAGRMLSGTKKGMPKPDQDKA
ncbi:MAG: TerB family tellurite resistance protein [Candidatus Saccharibacteria bacterium]|nr:TerB family tellurite resistance protein [Pseudorhodobacter sp.]